MKTEGAKTKSVQPTTRTTCEQIKASPELGIWKAQPRLPRVKFLLWKALILQPTFHHEIHQLLPRDPDSAIALRFAQKKSQRYRSNIRKYHQNIIKISSKYHQNIIKISSKYHQNIIKYTTGWIWWDTAGIKYWPILSSNIDDYFGGYDLIWSFYDLSQTFFEDKSKLERPPQFGPQMEDLKCQENTNQQQHDGTCAVTFVHRRVFGNSLGRLWAASACAFSFRKWSTMGWYIKLPSPESAKPAPCPCLGLCTIRQAKWNMVGSIQTTMSHPKLKKTEWLVLTQICWHLCCATAQSVHSSENNMFRSQSEATRTFNYLQGKTQMLEVCTFHDCRLQIMKGNLNLAEKSWNFNSSATERLKGVVIFFGCQTKFNTFVGRKTKNNAFSMGIPQCRQSAWIHSVQPKQQLVVRTQQSKWWCWRRTWNLGGQKQQFTWTWKSWSNACPTDSDYPFMFFFYLHVPIRVSDWKTPRPKNNKTNITTNRKPKASKDGLMRVSAMNLNGGNNMPEIHAKLQWK